MMHNRFIDKIFFLLVCYGMSLTFLFGMERKSLFEYQKMPELERLPRDVRNLCAPSWWYQDHSFVAIKDEESHDEIYDDNDYDSNEVDDGIEAMGLHPDGNQIALACAQGDLRLWEKDDTGSYQLCDSIKLYTEPSDLAYNPVTKALICAGSDGISLSEEDIMHDSKVRILSSILNSGIQKVAWSNDGKLLALAKEKSIALARLEKINESLDVNTTQLPHDFDYIENICFSPDGSKLAVTDEHLWLYDRTTGKCKSLYTFPTGRAQVVFHPRKDICITSHVCLDEAMMGAQISVWNILALDPSGKPNHQWPLKKFEINVLKLACHPHKDLVAIGSMTGIELADLNGNRLWRVNPSDPGQISILDMGFCMKGTTLATAGCDNRVTIFREYEKADLKQVLLRKVLKDYLKECIECRRMPQVTCQDENSLVPWMVQTFPLQETELQEVWHSIPEYMRKHIVNTFFASGCVYLRNTKKIVGGG